MRTPSSANSSHRSGSSRENDEGSIWTEAGDEQSYYTHYSDGSMGLAKRTNKKLQMVGYIPLEDDDQSMVTQTNQHENNTEDDADDDEAQAQDEESRQVVEETEGEESYQQRATTTTLAGRRGRLGHLKRNGYSSSLLGKTSSTIDPSSDNSSSTHKTRGGATTSSSGTSTNHHHHSYNNGADRQSPRLSVIKDTEDEDRDESPMQQEAPLARPKAENLTEEDTNKNREDTRSRRRERLARIARVVSPPKAVQDPDIKTTPAATAAAVALASAAAATNLKVKVRDRSISPQKTRRSLLKAPKYTGLVGDGERALSPQQKTGFPRSSSGKSLQVLVRKKEPVPHSEPEESLFGSLPPQTRYMENIRQRYHQTGTQPEQHDNKDGASSVEAQPDQDPEADPYSSPSKPDRRSSMSPRKQRRSSLEQASDHEHQQLADTTATTTSSTRSNGNPYSSQPTGRWKQQGQDGNLYYHQADTVGRDEKYAAMMAERPLFPVVEERNVRHVANASSDLSISDNSSIVTSNLQQGPPCISQIMQNTRFVTRGADGNPCILGYTQKCTSFVSGVWESCANIGGGYQTESKHNLLQLEMIAEQSVSGIYQTAGGRCSPEAFRHSRDLLAHAQQQDDSPSGCPVSQNDRSTSMVGPSSFEHIQEVGSDEATHEDLQHNSPFGFNVEGALTTISAKVQQAVGLNGEGHPNTHQSVMDDMRHMIDSFSTYYVAPHHQPYDRDDPHSPGPIGNYEYRHQYRHGSSNLNGAAATNANPLMSDETSVESASQEDGNTKNHPNQNPEVEQAEEKQKPQVPAQASIYNSVIRGTNLRDRRSMVLDLQKRRMKQVKRKEETWDTRGNKAEEDTAKLRRLYLGLYDKIHDEDPTKAEPVKDDVEQIKKVRIEEDLVDLRPDGRDDTFSDAGTRARDETVEEEREERDYAVVWAASGSSCASPRHSMFQAPDQSLVDDDDDHDEDEEAHDDADRDEYVDLEEEENDKAQTDPEATPSSLVNHEFVLQDEPESKPSTDSDHFQAALMDGDESVSTRFLDTRERESPFRENESSVAAPSTATAHHETTSVAGLEATKKETQMHEQPEQDDLPDPPQPDPTISVDSSTDAEEYDDDDDDKTMFTAVGTVCKGRDEPEPIVSLDFGVSDDEHAIMSAETKEGDKSFHTVHTTATTTTSEMEELVGSFLNNYGPPGSPGMSEDAERSTSSRPMVLLSEATFGGEIDQPDDERMSSRQEQQHQPQFGSRTMGALADDCSYSVHSDPTLADSTMMSGFSGSRHDTQGDLSLAETIVSVSQHSQSHSGRTSGTGLSDLSGSTPEPSDVPPEIAQPWGEVPEYQILYQISEEATDEENTSEDDEEEDYGLEQDASFEPQNDVPFDEDVSLEEYQNQQRGDGASAKSFGRWSRWVMAALLAYFFGLFDGVQDLFEAAAPLVNEVSSVPSAVKLSSSNEPQDTAEKLSSNKVQASITSEIQYIKRSRSAMDLFSVSPPVSKEEIVEIPIVDGISIVDTVNRVCRSEVFAIAESGPETESEAYRRAWARELQEALKLG